MSWFLLSCFLHLGYLAAIINQPSAVQEVAKRFGNCHIATTCVPAGRCFSAGKDAAETDTLALGNPEHTYVLAKA